MNYLANLTLSNYTNNIEYVFTNIASLCADKWHSRV